jgi:hypothetical protein
VEALGAREPSAAGANDGSSTTVRAACGTRVDRRLAISAHCRLFQRPPVEGSPQRRHYVKKPILPSPRRPGRSFPTDRYPARAVLSLATKPSLRREQRQQRVGAEDGAGRARPTDAAQPAAAHPVEAVIPRRYFLARGSAVLHAERSGAHRLGAEPQGQERVSSSETWPRHQPSET